MRAIHEIVIVMSLVMSCGVRVIANSSERRHKAGDSILLYANVVGPFSNPSETYSFYDLPFCLPDHVKEKKETFGEVLSGHRLVSTPYKLNFLEDKESEVACRKKLTKEEVLQFRNVVAKDYYMQMYYDDLPLWAFIGKVGSDGSKYLIFKHLQFFIFHNKGSVVEINVRSVPDSMLDVTLDKKVEVEFTYSVKWKETDTPFEKRFEKYTAGSMLPHNMEIHWFATMNSCVTVLVLIASLATFYMRVLRKDMMKYADDEELADNQEETGWKNIHGDVFRYPKHKSLFAAALVSGTQLFTLMAFILVLGVVGVFYPYNRGRLLTALLVIYAITSGIAGYTSVSFYCQLEGTNWVSNLLLTGLIFCGPIVLTFCFLNFVAASYRATAALPISAISVILLLWAFLSFPLLVLGGIAGKNNHHEFQAPCRTTKCPREIPQLRWYRRLLPQMALAGILPFGTIYVELYYIMASLSGHRIYTIYGILCIDFVVLLIVTSFVNVALTYFQLAAENHEWWWRSFLCGGSVGFFMYGYCIYYQFTRSDMNGFMQLSFFFGYMACISYGIFIMLGTMGFFASLCFLRHIYGSIKCD